MAGADAEAESGTGACSGSCDSVLWAGEGSSELELLDIMGDPTGDEDSEDDGCSSECGTETAADVEVESECELPSASIPSREGVCG
jgi:hypothetical protein